MRFILSFFLLVFISFSTYVNSKNKIIYLIAPPRSLATVFLRAMQARDDMIIFNEPSQYAFLADKIPHVLPKIFKCAPPFETYEKVRQAILRASEDGDVFVKDICYAGYENLYDNDQFISNPNITFCFIIRNPHPAIISHYRANGNKLYTSCWEVYERLYFLFEKIKNVRQEIPIVISAEDLSSDPAKIMSEFCEKIDIPFKDSFLVWPDLFDKFDPVRWNDWKSTNACMQWHARAIKSTHFICCDHNYNVDKEGKPTFIEIEEKDRGCFEKIYNYYMRFYNKMYSYRLQ